VRLFCWLQCTVIWSSKEVHRQPILPFLWQHLWVLYSWQLNLRAEKSLSQAWTVPDGVTGSWTPLPPRFQDTRHTKVTDIPGTHFILSAESTLGTYSGRKEYVNEKFPVTIGNRTRDLPACCAVPWPIAPPRSLNFFYLGQQQYAGTVLFAFPRQQWLGERPIVFDERTFPVVCNENIDFDAVKIGNGM